MAIDYGYIGKDDDRTGRNPILIGMEAKYSLCIAMKVAAKGNQAPWISKRIGEWLDCLGSKRCTIKSDGEPAMVALVREVRAKREEGTITTHECSVQGESQTDHLAEGGVAIVKGLIRTLIAALEHKYGERITMAHPIIPWLVEHAAHMRNMFQVEKTA